MLRLLSTLCCLMLFLIACQSDKDKSEKDDFPNFSEEQLNQMMQRQNPGAAARPQQKSLKELIAQMEISLAQHPNDTTLLYNLAKLTYQQYQKDSSDQNIQKTIAYYGKVLALDANYEQGRPHYNRMLAYMSQEKYEEALRDLEAFVVVSKGQVRVNHQAMKAKILFKQGKQQAACIAYKEALAVVEKDSLPTGLDPTTWQQHCP